jgi:CubicO group peptidase (beta-lactamase class C family)
MICHCRRIFAQTVIALATASATVSAVSSAAPADGGAAEGMAAKVAGLFATWDRPDTPGAAVAVIEEGKVRYLRGFGCANLEHGIPIGPQTVFDIASVSKQFTGMAVAMLADEGAICLGDDIRKYVPEVPVFGPTIELRHLVHHTSGLRDWPRTLALAGWEWDNIISMRHILTMVRHQRELNFPPGEEYTYSNTNYNLLAEVISRVSGKSFRAWTDARIFAPLKMTHTHFCDDHREMIARRASSYEALPGGRFQKIGDDLTALGSSSLYTTIEDLAKWVLNFDTQRVGGPNVIARMHQRGVLNSGTPSAYAYGLVHGSYRGSKTVSHSGGWAGFRTVVLRFPQQRFGVIVLSNLARFNPTRMARRVADIYLGDRLEPVDSAPSAAQRVPVQLDAAVLDRYVGRYLVPPGLLVQVTREGEGLFAKLPGLPRVQLRPTSVTEFHVDVEGESLAVDFRADEGGQHRTALVQTPRGPLMATRWDATAAAVDWSGFVGAYYSDELDTRYAVVVDRGTLTLRHRWKDDTPLVPQLGRPDRFGCGHGQVVFKRDGAGNIERFLYTDEAGRVRNLRFDRLP